MRVWRRERGKKDEKQIRKRKIFIVPPFYILSELFLVCSFLFICPEESP